LSLDLSNRIAVYLHGDYFGAADVPHEVVVEGQDEPDLLLVESQQYFQADLGLSWKIPCDNGLYIKLHTGVRNLFDAYQEDLDRGVNRDPAYVYGPSRPRSFFLGIETAF
jgi:outer membrane receptor for ferrienterochelin and colicins